MTLPQDDLSGSDWQALTKPNIRGPVAYTAHRGILSSQRNKHARYDQLQTRETSEDVEPHHQ